MNKKLSGAENRKRVFKRQNEEGHFLKKVPKIGYFSPLQLSRVQVQPQTLDFLDEDEPSIIHQ